MILSKKVNETRKTEQEYRAIKSALSYSSIKLFDSSREKFYKECVLLEPRKEKESVSTIMGSLVHCLLANLGDFDSKFHIASAKKPVGQIGELCDALFSRTMKSLLTNEYGESVQQDSFQVIFSDAFNSVKFDFNGNEVAFKKKELEWALEKFQIEGQMYYNECLECMTKTVVSIQQIEQAEKLVNKLKSHPYTADIVNRVSDKEVEIFTELPIEFKIGEVPYKCMPDRIHIDHIKKHIQPFDYKTSWQSENPERAYLSYSYYIQLGIYDRGIREFILQHPELKGYEVLPMIFIFVDTIGFMDPVLLKPSKDDIERAWRGFTVSGRIYSGIQSIIDSIQWCVSEGIWTTDKQLKDNAGVQKLTIRYGSR